MAEHGRILYEFIHRYLKRPLRLQVISLKSVALAKRPEILYLT